MTLSEAVVEAVLSVTGAPCRLHEPFVAAEDRACAAAAEVGVGPEQRLLEDALCEALGKAHCVLTSSGTTALHAALLASGANEQRTVRIPPVTYAATANAVLATGARLDYGSQKFEGVSWEQDVDLSVSLFGYRVGTEAAIEDACEAFGTKWVGLLADTVCLSFNMTKIVTAGQGGAIVTDDEGVARAAAEWTSQARQPGAEFWHARVAYNARMANINAALLLGQVLRIEEIVAIKQAQAESYRRALDRLDCEVWPIPDGWNAWLLPVMFEDEEAAKDAVHWLNAAGVEARMSFTPLAVMPPFAGPYRCRESSWTSRTILLPNGRMQ